MTPATSDPTSFALSPDGTQIVHAVRSGGISRLWLWPLASTTAQPLAGTDGGTGPFWSPDSKSIEFFADLKLKRLDLGGLQPQVLADAPLGRGGAWSATDVMFPPNNLGPLFRVAATGGEPVPVTTLTRQLSHSFPHFLPGGRQFLFFARSTPDTQGIFGPLRSAQVCSCAACLIMSHLA